MKTRNRQRFSVAAIVASLQRQVPRGTSEDFKPVAEMLCGGKKSVTVDGMILNAFANVPIGYTASDGGTDVARE